MGTNADFFTRFNARGYQYLCGTVGATEFAAGPAQEPDSGAGKDGSLYLQSNYLKFGQTSYNGALVLPALSAIEGTADVVVEFDWCWHLTGGMKPDLMTVSVDATVGQFPSSGAGTSLDIQSPQLSLRRLFYMCEYSAILQSRRKLFERFSCVATRKPIKMNCILVRRKFFSLKPCVAAFRIL